ncbi:zinc ribbon domain-containing protein [Collinsella bouchesdurhonensis]|uniref:zinc ribbon domain-containing protein n=1 Tax=Collinsella bouchesdurhonensis TaxID=1907654 RepID=UPI0034A37A5A
MFCRKCGAEMEGGARFCPKCGLPVADASEEPSGEFGQAPDDADEAVEQLVSVEDEGEPTGSVAVSPESADGSSAGKAFGLESDSADADVEDAVAPARTTRSKKPFIIAVIVVVLLILGGSGYYVGVVAPERAREAAEQEALAAECVVRVSVSAEGWDTAAGASRVPLRVKGREERGKKVNKVYYVDTPRVPASNCAAVRTPSSWRARPSRRTGPSTPFRIPRSR